MIEREIQADALLVMTSDDFKTIRYPVKMARHKNRLIGSVEAKVWALLADKLGQASPFM